MMMIMTTTTLPPPATTTTTTMMMMMSQVLCCTTLRPGPVKTSFADDIMGTEESDQVPQHETTCTYQ